MFVCGMALISPGTVVIPSGDPYWANVSLLLHADGTNGSTTFTDSSPTTKTVTASGSTISTAQYIFGGSSGLIATATSSNDLTIPNHTDFSLSTGDFTLEVWVYVTTVQISIILQKAVGTGSYPWQVYITSGSKFGFRGLNTVPALVYDLTSTTSVSPNTWYFIQARRSGNDFALAINGTQEATSNPGSTTLYSDTAHVVIGNYDSGATFPLVGYVDDVRITKGIARPFALPTTAFPNSSSPDLYWTNVEALLYFDGTNNSTTFTDSSSRAHTVTPHGTAKLSTAQFVYGTAAGLFNGTSDYLSLPITSTNFGLVDWTWEARIRWNTVGDCGIMTAVNGGTDLYLEYYGGTWTLGDNAINNIAYSAFTPVANTWYALALTKSGSTYRLFIDGTIITSSTTALRTDISCSVFQIGARANASIFFNGYIDEARITIGTARYTANYVPTTSAAFPNF
jgi:hypothetical protein